MDSKTAEWEIPIFPDPNNPLKIKIPIFEGPLDLLLHLIRKKELDIYKVRLSELTASYLDYLDYMKAINLEVAGEFLEMAATLIWIKSKHLLPKPPVEEEEIEEDPEERLRQQLIEYQRYKHAAFLLGSRDVLGRDVFSRPETDEVSVARAEVGEEIFEEVSLYALMESFRNIMSRPRVTTHVVEVEQYRIEDRIEELIQWFTVQPQSEFEKLFERDHSRALVIITFMATLEMVKFKLIRVVQEHLFGPILCLVRDEFHDNVKRWYEQNQPESERHIA